MERIADRLRRHRKKNNLTTAQVAQELGIAASTYREWEIGRQIRGEPYLRLARLFKISVAELLGGEDLGREQVLRDLQVIEELIGKIRLTL